MYWLLVLLIGISNPFVTAVGATGRIRKFQTIVGVTKLLTIPLCYLFLQMGCNPETALSYLYDLYCLCCLEQESI